MDRKNLIRGITAPPWKPSQCAQDCGAIKSRFDEIKKKLDITIVVKYSSKKVKEKEQFHNNRGGFLMLECDTQSKLIRRDMEKEQEDVVNIKHIGNHALLVDNIPCDRGVKELIRLIDSNRMAQQMCKNKFKENYHLIDIKARGQFQGATRSTVKCVIGHNHYGERHKLFNCKLPSSDCPRCGEKETWSHIIQCQALTDVNDRFVSEVVKKIRTKASKENQKQVVEDVNVDLRSFLITKTNKHVTNQSIIGWEHAFRGHVVKVLRFDCQDRNFNQEINRIIVKMCTNHYIECWNERNEHFRDQQKQRKHAIEWMSAIESLMLRSNKCDAIRCLMSQETNVQTTSTMHLQRRNIHLLQVYKLSKKKTPLMQI